MCSISPLQKVLLPESWLLPRCQDWPLDKRRSLGQVPSAHFRKRIPISTVERENIIPSPPASFLSPFSGIQLDSALEYVLCSQVRGIGVVIVSASSFPMGSDPHPGTARRLWKWNPSSPSERAARDKLCLPRRTYPGSLSKGHQLQGAGSVTDNTVW